MNVDRHTCLLHNMSAPPKSVVKYEGLSALATRNLPGGSGVTCIKYQGERLFGTPVRFELEADWCGLTPREALLRLGTVPDADPSRQLAALINRRADELPLPDGCAVIPVRDDHVLRWRDPLTMLAILSKSAATVWLRSKTPLMTVALRREPVSLLVPPAFAGRLPPVLP